MMAEMAWILVCYIRKRDGIVTSAMNLSEKPHDSHNGITQEFKPEILLSLLLDLLLAATWQANHLHPFSRYYERVHVKQIYAGSMTCKQSIYRMASIVNGKSYSACEAQRSVTSLCITCTRHIPRLPLGCLGSALNHQRPLPLPACLPALLHHSLLPCHLWPVQWTALRPLCPSQAVQLPPL